MYVIKQIPEDFIVKEVSSVKIANKGIYSYFLLTKRNYTTNDAIEKIAAKLRIPVKRFGFAGTKDKRAVTSQLVSIKYIKKDRLKRVKLKDLSIKFLGYGNEPISLGDLYGNEFTIIVRNLDKNIRIKKITKITNLFGKQRFSKRNHLIGKAIIKKDFKEAINLILESKGNTEKKVKNYLNKNPHDFIGALRTIPKKILKIYVHSYQSYIWNKTAEDYIKSGKKNIKIPITGFGSEFKNKKIKNIVSDIMKHEKICSRDFIIKEIPELSSEGNSRDLFIKIENLKMGKPEVDELNKGKNKVKISFKLQKGSYATIAVKELFEELEEKT